MPDILEKTIAREVMEEVGLALTGTPRGGGRATAHRAARQPEKRRAKQQRKRVTEQARKQATPSPSERPAEPNAQRPGPDLDRIQARTGPLHTRRFL